MSTTEICKAEANMLCQYLNSLPRPDRRYFIDRVTESASTRRRTFYNWQYALSRIPTHVKRIMEREASQKIFEWTPDFL